MLTSDNLGQSTVPLERRRSSEVQLHRAAMMLSWWWGVLTLVYCVSAENKTVWPTGSDGALLEATEDLPQAQELKQYPNLDRSGGKFTNQHRGYSGFRRCLTAQVT